MWSTVPDNFLPSSTAVWTGFPAVLILPQHFFYCLDRCVFAADMVRWCWAKYCFSCYLAFLPCYIGDLRLLTAFPNKPFHNFVVVPHRKLGKRDYKKTCLDLLILKYICPKILSPSLLVRELCFSMVLISSFCCCPYFPPAKMSDSLVLITIKISRIKTPSGQQMKKTDAA